MIEAFEFEPIRLGKTGATTTAKKSLSKNGVDVQDKIGAGKATWSNETPALDKEMQKVFQTRVGLPDQFDSHSARWMGERIASQGVKVADSEVPATGLYSNLSSSQILSRVLDKNASFVPRTDLGLAPPMDVVSPDEPFLSTGLTSIDSRKFKMNLI